MSLILKVTRFSASIGSDMGSQSEATEISNSKLLELLTKKIDQRFEELLQNIRQESESLNKKLSDANLNIQKLKEEKKILSERITLLERRVRKNNVAIFGLRIDKENFVDSCITQVNTVLKTNLSRSDISDLYQPRNNPKAPVIVGFLTTFKRREIFTKVRENIDTLKNAKVYITDDLSLEDREVLKVLKSKKLEAVSRGKTAKIVGRNIIIDGAKCSYEDLISDTTDRGGITDGEEYEDASGDENDLGAVVGKQHDSLTDKQKPGKGKKSKTPSPHAVTTRLAKKKHSSMTASTSFRKP